MADLPIAEPWSENDRAYAASLWLEGYTQESIGKLAGTSNATVSNMIGRFLLSYSPGFDGSASNVERVALIHDALKRYTKTNPEPTAFERKKPEPEARHYAQVPASMWLQNMWLRIEAEVRNVTQPLEREFKNLTTRIEAYNAQLKNLNIAVGMLRQELASARIPTKILATKDDIARIHAIMDMWSTNVRTLEANIKATMERLDTRAADKAKRKAAEGARRADKATKKAAKKARKAKTQLAHKTARTG